MTNPESFIYECPEIGVEGYPWVKRIIRVGDIYRVVYPFIKEKVTLFDEDGPSIEESWRPGTKPVMVYPDDSKEVAEKEGKMILAVIDIHKPGHYPERVFYTRRWEDPDGKQFGKNNLRIISTSGFRNLLKFRYEYEIDNEPT